ncbi:MAG: SDR family NAD(P)-dependent oxidoreductase [Mucilaginibacter sp.]|nr:SDR family NAD(P)-dependent oxidoreductase [Mucilaginibacter sp.]
MKNEKVWLITGSSRGLGRALASKVAATGDIVVATSRNIADLLPLKEAYPAQVIGMALDVTDQIAINEVVKNVIKKYGRIDVLVNNAGYGNINSIEETPLEDFRAQMETNLFGTVSLTKAVLPHMRECRSGHIIQYSSVGGRIGPIGRGAYAAAKWGVEGFSEVLQKEVSPLGIKVTIIEPGGFRTDFAGSSTKISAGLADYSSTVGATAQFQQDFNGKQPGDPDKAAKAVIEVVGSANPPLRLLLGTDALKAVAANDQERLKQLEAWRWLSETTDRDAAN